MNLSQLIETEGLVLVADLDDSSGYDWTEIAVYWHPTAQRFYWLSESGCSCNFFGDGYDYVLGDFEDGDRDAAIAALKDFSSYGYDLTDDDKAREISKVRDFTPEVTE